MNTKQRKVEQKHRKREKRNRERRKEQAAAGARPVVGRR
jgi:hypothetical protein